MVICSLGIGMGSSAFAFLEPFERTSAEHFSATPGVLLASRLRAMAKVLGNICQEVPLVPALLSVQRRSFVYYNRRPKIPMDLVDWRRRVRVAEAYAGPTPRLRGQMAEADRDLVTCVGRHRYLLPVEVDSG